MGSSASASRSIFRRKVRAGCSGQTGGFLRLLIAAGGGWLVLRLTGSLTWLFAALAFGLVIYGVTIFVAVMAGTWFRPEPRVAGAHGGKNG